MTECRDGCVLSYEVQYDDGDVEKTVKRGNIAPVPEEVRYLRLSAPTVCGAISVASSNRWTLFGCLLIPVSTHFSRGVR